MGDSNVAVKGIWTYADVDVAKHNVTYSWDKAPTDDYAQTLPTDSNQYVKGQGYTVDTTYQEGTFVNHFDQYGNIDAKWTFSGWDHADGTMGDTNVEIKGTWSYSNVVLDTYKVSYKWDSAPDGLYTQVLPATTDGYVKGQPYTVDTTFVKGTVVNHLDAYGNVDGT